MTSSYDVDSLLSILGKDSKESEPSSESPVEQFVKKFNIKADSSCKQPTYVIYYTYKELFKGNLSKTAFFRQFNKLFKQVRNGSQRYYKVSGSFDLSYEGLTKAEEYKGTKK